MIVRWEDVQTGQDIGLAAGALNVSLHRLEIAPEETAAQSDAAVEEIVFVLEGSGSWENGLELLTERRDPFVGRERRRHLPSRSGRRVDVFAAVGCFGRVVGAA